MEIGQDDEFWRWQGNLRDRIYLAQVTFAMVLYVRDKFGEIGSLVFESIKNKQTKKKQTNNRYANMQPKLCNIM